MNNHSENNHSDFFDFLKQINQLTQQKHYKWQTRSYDRASLHSEEGFSITIDKFFQEDTENDCYYVYYEYNGSHVNIAIYPSQEREYCIVAELYNNANLSSFVPPKLKLHS